MSVMVTVIAIVIGFVLLAVGGGVGYWIWRSSRPQKLTWKAYVYQVGDGVIKLAKGSKEKGVKYKLTRPMPYVMDIIERIDKKDGATHYWLQKLKKPTPVVTADCVEVWKDEKIVRVLLEEDSCTLLKGGYDRLIGDMIFRPMPHDRINMIKTELSERNARIEDTKDVLAQIFPFVTVTVAILGIVLVAYFLGQAAVTMGDSMVIINEQSIVAQKSIALTYIKGINCELLPDERIVVEEEPPTIPP